MHTTRHIMICEGESEYAYLQRLQAFLEKQELPHGIFETPLKFIVSEKFVVKTGSYGKMKSCHSKTHQENKKASIQLWADFDLYHRNDKKCADDYKNKTSSIPDFLFSFHNFEDFYALHFDGNPLADWLQYGGQQGRCHFTEPLHSSVYMQEIQRIFPDYKKGVLPSDFVSWASLKRLKANIKSQPTSNPHNFVGLQSFAQFLIGEIEHIYPGKLA